MADKKKFRKKKPDKVLVRSRAYGNHERAPRGSVTKAVLNTAMQKVGERVRQSTIPAKLILDALQPFREDFTGGMIWQRLIKHFAAQAKKGIDYTTKGIFHWDLNDEYPTSRIMAPHIKITADESFSTLETDVTYTFSNRFRQRNKSITAFRTTLIFLFPDFNKNTIRTVPVILPDKLLADSAVYTFIVSVPRKAKEYLVCFKTEGYINGKPYDSSRVKKAMCLAVSGSQANS